MRRCLELGRKGTGYTAPNPMVGSVIVNQDKIIGEGYHRAFGEPHAERIAINSVKNRDLLKDSSLFVNLEPCSHYGKTPPCSELIIKNRIPKVFIGIKDINPAVGGRGIEALRNSGCVVEVGILEKECFELNKFFYTYHLKKRPYVILKWAQTKDGFIDKVRDPADKQGVQWITDETSRALVHKWRVEVQSILIGTNTALIDNPRLTIRHWSGKNPLRLVIDRNGRLPSDLNLFDGSVETVVFACKERKSRKNLNFVSIDRQKNNIKSILEYLYEQEIQSLMVEGGATILYEFIRLGLWDEARIFIGPKEFKAGVEAPKIDQDPDQEFAFSNSTVRIYRIKPAIC